MWQFCEVWSCKMGDMIFQGYTFFSRALGVQKFEHKLVGGYCTLSHEIDGLDGVLHSLGKYFKGVKFRLYFGWFNDLSSDQ